VVYNLKIPAFDLLAKVTHTTRNRRDSSVFLETGVTMYFAYSFGVFFLSVAVMGLILRHLRRRGEPSCRGYLLGYLLAGLSPLIIMSVMTLLTSWFYFDGTCYGFTDGSYTCSFGEYLAAELGYAFYFFLPAVGLAFVAITLSFVFHWFFARRGFLEEGRKG
jgi:hypothetical protein